MPRAIPGPLIIRTTSALSREPWTPFIGVPEPLGDDRLPPDMTVRKWWRVKMNRSGHRTLELPVSGTSMLHSL